MMVGIGLGIMAILCAVGLIGGGIFMHHEWKDQKNQPAIQQNHNPPMAAEPFSQGNSLEEQNNISVPGTPIEGDRQEEKSDEPQQCPKC